MARDSRYPQSIQMALCWLMMSMLFHTFSWMDGCHGFSFWSQKTILLPFKFWEALGNWRERCQKDLLSRARERLINAKSWWTMMKRKSSEANNHQWDWIIQLFAHKRLSHLIAANLYLMYIFSWVSCSKGLFCSYQEDPFFILVLSPAKEK